MRHKTGCILISKNIFFCLTRKKSIMIIITRENFESEIMQAKKPVIIDASATWCGPCQYMKPIFEELAQELKDSFIFAELNVDDAREVAIKFGVSSVPTFIFLQNGQLKGKEMGSMSKEDLTAKIYKYLG